MPVLTNSAAFALGALLLMYAPSVFPAPPPDLSGQDPHWIKAQGKDCWLFDAQPAAGEIARWNGACKDRLATGFGVQGFYVPPSANTLGVSENSTGTMISGVMQGSGTVVSAASNGVITYRKAEFVDGTLEGSAYETISKDGVRTFEYTGTFVHGNIEGQGHGIWYNSTGAVTRNYEGLWRNGDVSSASANTGGAVTQSDTSQRPRTQADPGDFSILTPFSDRRWTGLYSPDELNDIAQLHVRYRIALPEVPGTSDFDAHMAAILSEFAGITLAGKTSNKEEVAIAYSDRASVWIDLARSKGGLSVSRNELIPTGTSHLSDAIHYNDEFKKKLALAQADRARNEKAASEQAEYIRKVTPLLAHRKVVGDRVCDGNGNAGYVEEVAGNKIKISTQHNASYRGTVINAWQEFQWMNYDEVFKCAEYQ